MSANRTTKRKPADDASPAGPTDSPAARPAEAPEEAAQAPQALTAAQIAAALADPFPADVVGWKPQTANGARALAVAYIDARDVMDRLDEVMGIDGWMDQYAGEPDGCVRCTLSLLINGKWVSKVDVGGESEQKDAGDKRKAAYSDALKRAAVKWGVGRYLYSLPSQWADYDEHKRAFVRPPSLPAWALPGGSGRPGVQAPPRQAGPAPEAAPQSPAERSRVDRLHDFDRKLTAEGLCKAGALVLHVAQAAKAAGRPADMTAWDDPAWAEAGRAARAFELERLHDLAERLFDQKGRDFERDALPMLKLPRGTPPSALDAAQVRRVVEALRQYPDRAARAG